MAILRFRDEIAILTRPFEPHNNQRHQGVSTMLNALRTRPLHGARPPANGQADNACWRLNHSSFVSDRRPPFESIVYPVWTSTESFNCTGSSASGQDTSKK